MVGPGRLADPEIIAEAVAAELNRRRDLEGETVLITAGPTQEPLDPVRFISNRSSGKMGYALAAAAADRGARVILVSGPVQLAAPRGVRVVPVRTANEMRDPGLRTSGLRHHRDQSRGGGGFSSNHGAATENQEDVRSAFARAGSYARYPGRAGTQKERTGYLIGFAAETENLEREARRKLETKNCDMIVANLVGGDDTGFESDQNEVALALRTGEFLKLPRASKRELADEILDQALRLGSALGSNMRMDAEKLRAVPGVLSGPGIHLAIQAHRAASRSDRSIRASVPGA